VTQYALGFVPEADDEFWKLSESLRRELRSHLAYLKSGPFRSHPDLHLKEVAEVPGAWRFHLRQYRVFYRVDGRVIWIVMIWKDRPSAYSRSTLREVKRRMR
jgi:mRNA-degrading endonuclease RelE of RelBE toxin-antitoxin system